MKKYIVPAGTYWLGDPCYSVPRDLWDEWLHSAVLENNMNVLRHPSEVWPIALGIATEFGDGSYKDNYSRLLCVDSGLIGLVEEAWVPNLQDEVGTRYKVTFDNPVECYSRDGVITIGDILIPTAFDEDEEWF